MSELIWVILLVYIIGLIPTALAGIRLYIELLEEHELVGISILTSLFLLFLLLLIYPVVLGLFFYSIVKGVELYDPFFNR